MTTWLEDGIDLVYLTILAKFSGLPPLDFISQILVLILKIYLLDLYSKLLFHELIILRFEFAFRL